MRKIFIGERCIDENSPVYVIAEISANHLQDFDRAETLVRAAKYVGADAVKFQTYTADTLTLNSDADYFKIKADTIWDGKTLHALYREAHMPWEWQPKLKKIAEKLDIDCFSTPFDGAAVGFLECMDVPAYKVASFELVDIPLLEIIARTGKPVIMSTGMATKSEICEAVRTLRAAGNSELILLKCVSAYPASSENMNLRMIPYLSETFDAITGLSDHTLSDDAVATAVALGAKVVERHLTLDRKDGGADALFSSEPEEFREMVERIRRVEKILGDIQYGPAAEELGNRVFRRSLFVVEDVRKGDAFTKRNVRSIRPAHGLHTRYYEDVLGKTATVDIKKGTPLRWSFVKTDFLQKAR